MESPSFGNNPSGSDIVLQIVSFAQVTDLDAGNGRMNKPVIIQINPDMGNPVSLTQGMEENKVPLPQILFGNPAGSLVLICTYPGQLIHIVYTGQ
jgi:hypothetical protein